MRDFTWLEKSSLFKELQESFPDLDDKEILSIMNKLSLMSSYGKHTALGILRALSKQDIKKVVS